jgi:dTMP kinase
VLIDVDPETGLARRDAAGEANRLDREPAEFHRRVQERYRALAAAEPHRFRVLDGRMPADRIEADVWAAVSARLVARAR